MNQALLDHMMSIWVSGQYYSTRAQSWQNQGNLPLAINSLQQSLHNSSSAIKTILTSIKTPHTKKRQINNEYQSERNRTRGGWDIY